MISESGRTKKPVPTSWASIFLQTHYFIFCNNSSETVIVVIVGWVEERNPTSPVLRVYVGFRYRSTQPTTSETVIVGWVEERNPTLPVLRVYVGFRYRSTQPTTSLPLNLSAILRSRQGIIKFIRGIDANFQ